jgi:ParB-like chromosome segregation protein Spo0J
MLNFRPHEYALLLPAMGEQDYAELKVSIAKNGLIDEIVLYEGKILEGVHRFKACKELGIEPRLVNWDDLPEEVKQIGPLAYVYAKNIPRRHLTTEQRTEAALKLLPLLKQEAQERQKAGKTLGPNEPKGRATEIAAEMVGVSTSTVKRALREEQSESDGTPVEEPESDMPEIELHVREFTKDVRDMISKVLHHHTDWSYGQRAWLCSKAGSKLAALARELSKQEKDSKREGA